MATLLNTQDFSSIALSAITGPTITNVQVTDSNYNALTATALSTVTGGYIKITGTNFTVGTNVYVDYGALIPASSVTYVSSTQLNVKMPNLTAGSYMLVLVTNTGSVAIRINGVTYAVTPIWVTSPGLTGYNGVQISINLASTIGFGDSVTYSVASGSALPTGLALSSAGLLSGVITNLSSSTVYNFTLSAIDSENQTTSQTFTLAISVQIDPYFSQSLLINGETLLPSYVLDSSTNNYQVVPYGLQRSDIFNPFYGNGYYSLQFNGTTDYIYGGVNTSAYTEGPGSYTLEGFFNLNQTPGGTIGTSLGIMNTCASTTATSAYHAWGFYTLNQIAIGTNNGLTYTYVTITQTLPLYAWFHLAIVYNGTTNVGTIYYNGTQVGTWTDATTYNTVNTGIWMVGSMYGTTGLLKGYVSSLRFVKNIAVYTSSFTVSLTYPIQNYTNYTALLLCQNSTFSDNGLNSGSNIVYPAGSVKVSVYIPYVASSIYSTYGSGYFNGSTDYATVPSNTNLSMIGSDFTLECFVYLNALPTAGNYYIICSKGASSTSNLEYQFSIYNNSGSYKLDLQLSINGTTVLEYQSNTIILYINQWYGISVSKLLATAYFWLNGVSAGQFVVTGSSLYAGSAPLSIGALLNATPTYYFSGYISNFRLIKGTGIYYLPYTLATTPLTNALNTQLLTLQYNGAITNNGFIDTGPFNNIITRSGNASQGTFTPYSQTGWAVYFDGFSGYFTGTPSVASTLNLSSGSFTIEAWIYIPALAANQYVVNLANSLNATSGLTFGINSAGYPFIGNGSTTNVGSIAITTNSWNHIAVSSNGTTCVLYTNGAPNGAGVVFNPNSSGYIFIGRDAGGTTYLNGYISNLRIIKGSQIYTTTFTPSVTPLTPIINTVFLFAQTNRFIDISISNIPLLPYGLVQIQSLTPFIDNINIPVTYSTYFPGGTSTYITTTASQIIPASYPYTIECWINISTYTNNPVIVSQGTSGNAGRTSFFINSSGYLSFGIGSTIITSTGTVPLNQWTYVAIVIGQNSGTFYINNTTSGTTGITGTPQASPLVICGDWQSSPSITGYISNLRVSNIARNIYSAPSTYFTSDIGCTLLAFIYNSGISDLSPSNNTLTITGVNNIIVSQYNPFNGTLTQPIQYSTSLIGSSIYLNGVTDYLTIPPSINNYFGTTNFTVEFWLYLTVLPSTGTNYSIVDFWPLANGSYLFGSTNNQWTITLYSTGQFQFIYATSLTGLNTMTTAKTITTNSWNHAAFVRYNNVLTAYINGVPDTVTLSLTGISLGYTNYNASIGIETSTKSTATLFNGYLSNIRINSYALYTTPFSPPTQPFAGTTSGTLLLLTGNAIGVSDLGSNINLITYNTSAATNIYKFGSSSIYFNGVSSYTLAPYNPYYNLSSGNFTIEFWAYFNSTSANQQIIGQFNATYFNWGISVSATNTISYYLSSVGTSWNLANAATIGTFTTGSWYHVALVRNGNSITGYLNGTAGTTTTTTSSIYTVATPLTIGALYNSGSSTFDAQTISTFANYFNGYLDDLRITKGIARYTTAFTPPTIGAFTQ
jgi:hypothetical protein